MHAHTHTHKSIQELLPRNSYTKKTKVFKDTKRQQITQTIKLQKTRPSSSLTADCYNAIQLLNNQGQEVVHVRSILLGSQDFFLFPTLMTCWSTHLLHYQRSFKKEIQGNSLLPYYTRDTFKMSLCHERKSAGQTWELLWSLWYICMSWTSVIVQ